jgi:hypothetical protein
MSTFKRILPEDFKKDDRELIGQLAYVFNPVVDQLNTQLDNGLTFEANISIQIKTLTAKVDETGKPVPNVAFKWDLTGRCIGLWCIYAQNTSAPNTYPTSQPFLSFTENNGQILINNISGLQPNQNYTLRVLALN